MMNKILLIIMGGLWFVIGYGVGTYNDTQKKYKMNLKCVQGELYEEIRPHFYVKSHLDCFEERTY